MNHQQMVREIALRLPHLKRRDVAEVLEVMAELWLVELARPDATITIADLGKLLVEVQDMRSGGAVQRRMQTQHGPTAAKTLKRIYVRLRPTGKLRAAILAGIEGSDDQ